MNSNNIYDIAIVGAGPAGSLAALRIAQKHPHIKIALIDLGRPPGKRRRQIEGFMGCVPFGGGRFYQNNFRDILNIADGRKVNALSHYLMEWLQRFDSTKYIKDTLPSSSFCKKIEKNGWTPETNPFFQWSPKSLRKWTQQISDFLEHHQVNYHFDTHIDAIEKINNDYKLSFEGGEIWASKVLLAAGRTGWRWLKEILQDLHLDMEDDWAELGLRLEISGQYIKELHNFHGNIYNHTKSITLGPLNWQGTVIPEDHADLVISAFRSNEVRWKSEKLSMLLIKKINFSNQGVEQNERLAKLAYLLLNDRVSREKIKLLMKDKIIISKIKEFDWLYDTLTELNEYLPNLINKGYFYVPSLIARPPRVVLNKNLETQLPGLFLAGESANQFGIISAALTGMIAADGMCI